MFCRSCGTQLSDSSRFCGQCGAAVDGAGAAARSTSMEQLAEGPYAGFWRRVGAYFVDLVLALFVGMVIGVSTGLMGDTDKPVPGLIDLVSLVGWWLYSAIMESSPLQATLGKMALGVKVTDLEGRRIGFGRATGRYFAQILSSLTLGIGYLMAAFTRRRQCLHDKIAGTLVVRRGATEQQLAANPEAPRVGTGQVVLIVLACSVIPVTGILAAIAIPAYQDYLIRAQVADGLLKASAHKAAVAEAVASGATFEEISSESIELPGTASSEYVEAFDVQNGVVVVVYGGKANPRIVGKQVILMPGVGADGELVWVCGYAPVPKGVTPAIDEHEQYTDVPAKYLPSTCRVP